MKGLAFYGQEFLVIKEGQDLIRENLIRILLTSPGERPMSDFGCRLKEYIMEPSNILKQDVDREVKRAISRWEPRIEVRSVSADIVDDHSASIKLECMIKETFQDFNFETTIRF